MSWQLAAFSILALALAAASPGTSAPSRCADRGAGGTLAAFAALGRIAFAAVPNVKPTTDIVLISGYALGGGPGFVVGALAGLTSNFFFGQGPWTPWQMAAWGATGLIGAGLAMRHRAAGSGAGRSRWSAASSASAFTAMQDFGDWVTYSDHSARPARRLRRQGARVRPRPRGRLRAVCARVRAGADALDPRFARRLQRHVACRRRSGAVAMPAPVARALPASPPRVARGWLAGQPAGGWAPGAASASAAAPPPATCSRRRTPTAASAPRPGRPPRSCSPAGRRSGSRRRATTRSDVSRGGPACSTTSARAAQRPDAGSLERTILVAAGRRRCRRALRRPRSGRGARSRHPRRRLGLATRST